MRISNFYRHGEVSVGFLALTIFIAAFFTRILPLSISQYPFNNDALAECGIASDILRNGHLTYDPGAPWYGTHGMAIPILDLLLAFVAGSLGVTPLACAQFVNAVFSVTTVGGLFVLVRSVSGSNRAAFFA